ncbi:MAG: Rrf2 family transcriptional regulator [Bacillota bacterium]
MRLSTKSRYGLRALCALALLSREGAPVSLTRIAQRENISRQYLSLIFQKLRECGFVEAVRGVRGGFRLARNPSEITVGSVVNCLDGPVAPVDCLAVKQCSRQNACVARGAWEHLKQRIELALEEITIECLIKGKNGDYTG